MKKRKFSGIAPIPLSVIILISVLIVSALCTAGICVNSSDPLKASETGAKLCIVMSVFAGGITLKLSGGTKSELFILSAAITLLLLAGECIGGITAAGIIMLCATFAAINAGYFLMTIRRGKRKRKKR